VRIQVNTIFPFLQKKTQILSSQVKDNRRRLVVAFAVAQAQNDCAFLAFTVRRFPVFPIFADNFPVFPGF